MAIEIGFYCYQSNAKSQIQVLHLYKKNTGNIDDKQLFCLVGVGSAYPMFLIKGDMSASAWFQCTAVALYDLLLLLCN